MKKELVKDIVQWDVRSWSKALHYWDSRVDWSSVRKGLELGGREGGLSLWLAKKGVETVCSDLKDTRAAAHSLHQQHGVSSLIRYEDIDACAIPYEDHFDVVVFKSIIGGIGSCNNIARQQQAFDAIHKALKPGGMLLFAENLSASWLHQQFRKKFVRWGDSWRYITVEETEKFVAKFSSRSIKTTGVLGTFGRTEAQRGFLAFADDLLLNFLSPPGWKYIVYGIAVK